VAEQTKRRDVGHRGFICSVWQQPFGQPPSAMAGQSRNSFSAFPTDSTAGRTDKSLRTQKAIHLITNLLWNPHQTRWKLTWMALKEPRLSCPHT
jgi:hypothetical protein